MAALQKALEELDRGNVTQVDLRYKDIGDIGAKALAEALARNNSLATLWLNSNQIGDIGAKALAEALAQNNSLTHLNLYSNQIGDVGAKALAEAFARNNFLTMLDLNSNQIGVEGAKALADALARNNSLTTLYLYSNQIGNVGAKALAEALARNNSLATLWLNSNQIGDIGAKALAEALAQNNSLTHLNLYSNQIGDVGATAVAEALARNNSLTTLDLSHNRIGDVGAKALADALDINYTVQTIKNSDNNISSSLEKRINDAVTANNNTTTQAKKKAAFEQRMERLETDTDIAALSALLVTSAQIRERDATKYATALVNDRFTVNRLHFVKAEDLASYGIPRGDVSSILAFAASTSAAPLPSPNQPPSLRIKIQHALRTGKQYAIFISYHQGGAADAANILHAFFLSKGFNESEIFFDKSLLHDVRQLSDAMKQSCVLLQIQSAELFFRPFTLIEAHTAFTHKIPVVPVALNSYNFAAARDFLTKFHVPTADPTKPFIAKDFASALNRANPGAVEVIKQHGRDPAIVGQVLASEFPNLISKPYEANQAQRVREAQLLEIFEYVLTLL